ncbi:sensor histidine kinase [Alishewanella longhuensis]|uniref:histidine kinase n=1 Tax=Alishewanella longhuensis TaxID=1091037 RepID=A0ABQ3L0D4_9ALTE|nr:ATP-binding protein [Alishewanella longhuensis]GHG69446.1 sensor histidine kinase [Alishewanella longhuensis]
MSVNFAKVHYDDNHTGTALPWLAAPAVSNGTNQPGLHHIIQSLPSAVILLDSRGLVAEANQVAIDMLGEPLQGQRWLDVINRCFRPRIDDGLEVSLADGRRVKIAISTLAPQAGQLIVLTDLTETRELQHRLSHLQRLSTLGKMMATLAHQIRTPLSSALLYAENLSSPKLTAVAREQFQQKLIARLNDLEQQVNDMLLFARSGTAQAVNTLSLQQLCDDLKNRSEALIEQHGAQLYIKLTQPEVLLLGNQTSLVEALLNLLQNSLQASAVGAKIYLTQQVDRERVVLQFSDNGPGIPVEIQPHIFEPFFSRKAGGSGLGLAVVQAVIHSHQGVVRYIDNHQNTLAQKGACFEIVLPVHQQLSTPNNGKPMLPPVIEELAHV